MKILLSLSLIVCINFSYGQQLDETNTVFIDKAFAKQIKEATDSITVMMSKKMIPGLSVCVSSKGKIIWAQGFGYSDVENKTPVKINTKFRVGSVSKTITAVGLAKLADENRVNLDSPVTRYVSYWPYKKYPITLRQIGGHVAGIRHYRGKEFLSAVHYNSVKESLDIFKDDSLNFEPGTQYSYSSYGYNLLSAAMETASGESFLQFLQHAVFDPLNMHNTTADYNDSIVLNRTHFYDVKKNTVVNATYVDNSNKWAGGGILSTPYDLIKLGNALLREKFLSEKSRAALWTPYQLSTGKPNVYGIGFRNETDEAGRTYISHGGTSMGGRTYFIIYPKEEIVMAITYNYLPGIYDELPIANIFVKK